MEFGMFLLGLGPILWMIVALCGLKMAGHKASFVAMVLAAVLAITVWKLPLLDTASAAEVDVQTESSAQAALDDNPELADTFGTLQVIPDYDTGFMELESGAVDAVAMDIVVASYQIESRGADFTILDESIATEEYGIGFAKGNEALRDTVQATLEEMAADGTMAEISEKWFGEDITTIGK